MSSSSSPQLRTVLITGATQGIGRALAGLLAAEGCALGLLARNGDELTRLAGELGDRFGTAVTPLPCDVRDAAAVEAAVGRFAEQHGHLDAAVLCAAVLGKLVPTDQSDPAEWAETLAINLNGSYHVARAVSRAVQVLSHPGDGEKATGRILFVSSSVGPRPRTPWGAYAVSKAGVEALMELMAGEAPDTGVLAASINPGGTATAMRAMAYPEEDPVTLPSAEAVAGTLLQALRLPGPGFNGQRFTSRDWL